MLRRNYVLGIGSMDKKILMDSNQILMKMRLLLTFNLMLINLELMVISTLTKALPSFLIAAHRESSHLKGQSTIAEITESLWKFCWKWWPRRCNIFVFLELTCCRAINQGSPGVSGSWPNTISHCSNNI
ncbi:hypothetical protein KY289_036837 [Solanum tuberosum]|nr:hypothetical protein KY289_036837 [Solanum tuberosum]